MRRSFITVIAVSLLGAVSFPAVATANTNQVCEVRSTGSAFCATSAANDQLVLFGSPNPGEFTYELRVDNNLLELGTLTGVTGDVRINTKDGDDSVVVAGAELPGDLNILSGRDNDEILLIDTTVQGTISMLTVAGDDVVQLGEVNVGNDLVIRTDGGEDTVLMQGIEVTDRLHVDTGADNDVVDLAGLDVGGTLRVHAAAGDDDVALSGAAVGGQVTVLGATGNDNISVVSSIFQDGFVVQGGARDDVVFVQDVTVEGSTTLNGQSGNDTLQLRDPNNFAEEAKIVSFETEGPLVDLQLLSFNDYHGHVESTTPGTINGQPAGGGEYLSAKLTELRQGSRHSLTVAAGDLIGGSPAFSGLFHDEPSVETLNEMGLDVSGVGNHEFDEGVTELLRMQDGGCHPVDGCYFPSDPYSGADFQWLAANVVNDAGDTPLPAYQIEVINGVEVAFIGMTLEATDTLVAAAGIQGWNFLDEAETANALVPELKAQGVEAIVVLLHEGGSQTPPPGDVDACVGISGPIVAINAALDPEIDAMITGHTHLPYNCVLPDSAGQPRIVTSAYSFGRVVSEVNLVLDKRTNDVRRDLSSATNYVVDQASLTPDPAITSIIDKWQPLFDMSGNTPIGTITADINRGGTPPGSDRGVESSASNLVADAQLWATSSNGADVAFMNPGGVRSDLLFAQSDVEGDGVVTFGEAFTFQPFGNTLVTYEMTGAQIISVLEEQCQPAGSSRAFLHLGVSEGFSYDLATTIAASECTSVSITNVVLNGASLDPAGSYNVTVNSFLADGGDNFATLGAVTSPRLDGGVDLQALSNYLGTFGPVAPPSTDRANELP